MNVFHCSCIGGSALTSCAFWFVDSPVREPSTPSRPSTVLLVRHGESTWNVVRRQGEEVRFTPEGIIPDSPLTELGVQQSKEVCMCARAPARQVTWLGGTSVFS